MVNTNMWADEGGSIVITPVGASGDPYVGMLLLCGPLYWRYKQRNGAGELEPWGTPRPDQVQIMVELVDPSGLSLAGESGVFERRSRDGNLEKEGPDDFWAISIALDEAKYRLLEGMQGGQVVVKGTKIYRNFPNPNEAPWLPEPLLVRVAV